MSVATIITYLHYLTINNFGSIVYIITHNIFYATTTTTTKDTTKNSSQE